MLNIWTIYEYPADFPNQYVVRRYEVNKGHCRATDELYTADTLPQIRKHLPKDLFMLPREPTDDPKIIESWI